MLPQIGFSEILVLGVIALIVVGPKDLPALLRKFGFWTAKAKNMANEFRGAFDDMGHEAELDALQKEIQSIKESVDITDLEHEFDAKIKE